jgi:Homeodomain-like domain
LSRRRTQCTKASYDLPPRPKVKKYVVRLSGEEREQLAALIRKGRSPAQRLMKARILLKADVSEAGEGWRDNQIIDALGTSASMVYRVRKQLVEEGFESVLSRKPRATPAVFSRAELPRVRLSRERR